MDRTNLDKKNAAPAMWKGKFLRDMDDQEYVYTLEIIIEFLQEQIILYKEDIRRMTERSRR